MMANLGALIRQVVQEEVGARQEMLIGTIQTLNGNGEHYVTTDVGLIVARSVTDEQVRVGDIVTLLMSGSEIVILGGAK